MTEPSWHRYPWSAREWAVRMTRQPSVTGSADEIAFGPWLAEELKAHFPAGRSSVWTFAVKPGDGRQCVALLVRGLGRVTMILTGHYDTVSLADYDELAPVATDPDRLAAALQQRLDREARTPAERRARTDLASGDFLPGRGLLDMKGGLAAGLAVAERFALEGGHGNLLFLAVPDEEASSDGARRAAPELSVIARDRGLDLVGAVNLDAMNDDEDGDAGRVVALSTIGKVLPTAFVIGLPTHGGYPLAGLNAAVLASAIAQRIEWAAELTDFSEGPCTPPSLLMLRDGKAGYDVTTPSTAFAAFNVLIVSRTPGDVLDSFDALCREAVATLLGSLRGRMAELKSPPAAISTLTEVPVMRFSALVEVVRRKHPRDYENAVLSVPAGSGSLPERCRLLTEHLWQASGLTGPAIVTGYGSVPYLPTRLSDKPAARRLAASSAEASETIAARHATPIRLEPVFAGISDMSFLGEADEASLACVAENMPGWAEWVRWPDTGGIAGLPIVNAGPWGRDYHTRLERIHAGYAFDVLPDLVQEIVRGVLEDVADERGLPVRSGTRGGDAGENLAR